MSDEYGRKRGTGRVDIYHAGDDTISDVQELKSASSLLRRVNGVVLYHPHATCAVIGREECSKRPLCCWHCCHAFPSNEPVFLPSGHCASTQTFMVYGFFCGLSCAKGYLMEKPLKQREQQLLLFSHMCETIYNERDVHAAPPRLALDIFGGPYSIEKFRCSRSTCRIIMSPFVAHYMVLEEVASSARVQETRAAPHVLQPSHRTLRGMRRPTSDTNACINEDEICSARYENLYKRYSEEVEKSKDDKLSEKKESLSRKAENTKVTMTQEGQAGCEKAHCSSDRQEKKGLERFVVSGTRGKGS
eukprot:6214329-Pleurochrysis_carterae.AAC.3